MVVMYTFFKKLGTYLDNFTFVLKHVNNYLVVSYYTVVKC